MAVAIAVGLSTGVWATGLVLGGLVALAPWLPPRGVGALVGAAGVLGLLAGLAGVPPAQVVAVWLGVFVAVERSPSGAGGPRQLLVLALLLVVAGTLSGSVAWVVAVAAWLAAVPTLLRVPARLVVGVLLVAAPLFLLAPRWGGPVLARTGFGETLSLGDLDALLDDPTRVFSARFDPAVTGEPYFRGVALDRFDGRVWTSSSPRFPEPEWDGRTAAARVSIVLEPTEDRVLFVPGTVDGLAVEGASVERDAAGAYHVVGEPDSVRYTAFVRPPYGVGRVDPFLDAVPTTALPPLDPAVKALIEAQVPMDVPPAARMAALRSWLARDYAYSRTPGELGADQPLERFLLTAGEGHCEYFAGALAVAGRVAGVPTRVVNGFLGGEAQPDGSIVVRRYHAHAWVEYFDTDHWVTIDATPEGQAPAGPGAVVRSREALEQAWVRVLDFDRASQVRVVQRYGVLLGVGLAGVVMIFVVARRRRLRRTGAATVDPVTRIYEQAVSGLEAQGFPTSAGASPVTRARELARMDRERGRLLEELAWLSYEVRYGGRDPVPRLGRARALLQALGGR